MSPRTQLRDREKPGGPGGPGGPCGLRGPGGGAELAGTMGQTVYTLLLPLLVPSALNAVSRELVSAVIPIYGLQELGNTKLVVGVLVAAAGLGRVTGNLPAGLAVQACSAKLVMLAALLVDVVGNCISLAFPYTLPIVAGRVLAGAGFAFFQVSRQTFVAESVQGDGRGMVMSAVGGARRWAGIVAPALGGWVAGSFGVRSCFFLQVVMTLTAFAMMATFLRVPALRAGGAGPKRAVGYDTVLRHHWRPLGTVALFTLPLCIVREARHLLLPLRGVEIGLSQEQIGGVASIGFVIDALIFPLPGYIMDRFGRRANAVPSVLVFGLLMLFLPLAKSFGGLAALSASIGFSNGFGSGLVMAIGADLAPAEYRGPFLAVFRLTTDLGFMLGPLITGAIAERESLFVACVFAACCGTFAAVWMFGCVGETLKKDEAAYEAVATDEDAAEDAAAGAVEPSAARGSDQLLQAQGSAALA